jgi:hypothetical protein
VWFRNCNQYTLPDLSYHVQNVSFFDDIADVKDPTIALLSKVLNCACHSRKYGTVAESALFESPDDQESYDDIMANSDWRSVKSKATKGGSFARERVRFVESFRSITPRRDQFKLIILCSLLGNYQHVAAKDKLLDESVRLSLYNEFQCIDGRKSRPEDDVWLQSILHQSPMLMVWCVREYFVYALLSDPALLDSVRDTLQFARFKSITGRAMAAIRNYLAHQLVRAQTNAYQCLRNSAGSQLCRCMNKIPNTRKGEAKKAKAPCRFQHHTWLHDINVLIQPYHSEMLQTSYRKHDAGLLSFLIGLSVRVLAPLKPRPLNDAEKQVKQSDAAALESARNEFLRKEAEERLYQGMQSARNSSHAEDKPTMQDMAVRHASSITAEEREAHARATTLNQADVFNYLSPKQFEFLSRLANASTNDLGRVADIRDMVRSFTYCANIPHGVVTALLDFIDAYQRGGMTKRALLQWLVEMSKRAPHAYNLLQVSAELIKAETTRHSFVVGHMPAHVVNAQVQCGQVKTLDSLLADDQSHETECMSQINYFSRCLSKEQDTETRTLLTNTIQELQDTRETLLKRMESIHDQWKAIKEPIEPSFVHLHTCGVCNAVASNVRGPPKAARGRKYYRWGLESVKLNFSQGTLHCHRARMNHRGRCFDLPLETTNLVGIRYVHGKRAFQLCVGCADIMIPDFTSCLPTKDGLLCSDCSIKRLKDKTSCHKHLVQWSNELKRVCVICNNTTRSERHTYLYPFGVVCCLVHHKRFLIRAAEQALQTMSHINNYTTMAQHLIDAHVARKSAKAKRMQPKLDRRMRAARQRNRMRTRR